MKRIVLIIGILCIVFGGLWAQNTADKRGYIVKVGDMAPDFKIEYLDGTTTMLKDLRGKIVMLQFTASWCSVCRKEMPFIEEEIWKVYKDKGLVLLGVDREEPPETVKDFAKKMEISYPLILDQKSDIFQLFADKGAGVTRNVIIDKSGKIVMLTRLFERKEFDEMKEKIKTLLED